MSTHSILGILPTATNWEIREAFLASALRAHPDRGGSDEKLQKVLHAFERLCQTSARGKCFIRCEARARKFHASKEGRKCSTLPRLCKLLFSLPVEQRRSVLQHRFSQPQRLQLERWMLAQQEIDRREEVKDLKDCELFNASRTSSLRRRVQSVVRVTRGSRKYRYYLASAAVDGLRLMTRTVSSLEVALRFHSLLVVVKQRTYVGSGSFESRFRNALSTTLSEFDVDPDSMGLKIIVSLRVLWMKTPLRTPAYFVASHLDKGLQALHRLQQARGHAQNYVLRTVTQAELDKRWAHIRGEYLDIMMEAGCNKQAVMSRLDVLDRERSSKLQEQIRRWLTVKDRTLQNCKRKSCAGEAQSQKVRRIKALLSRWNLGNRRPSGL
ncbi:unnamed protein product [Durusdinium trenchii]|uniref:J domain-containing protein n=1 Tax=Durusdinium trenchii TaxID=1381693 RepID=A0ABP0NEQ5_9DINO